MTGVYTEDILKFLTKPHIIDLLLKMQKHTNSIISKLTNGIRNLNVNFKRLESNVEVCKKVNDALVKPGSFPLTSMLEKRAVLPKGVFTNNRHA